MAFYRYREIAFRVADVYHTTGKPVDGGRPIMLEIAEEQHDGTFQVVRTGIYGKRAIARIIQEALAHHYRQGPDKETDFQSENLLRLGANSLYSTPKQ